MQIAILSKNNKNNILNSLVPMFGDSFFTCNYWFRKLCEFARSFRPHVWGFFFHKATLSKCFTAARRFRPHVWGFFFHMISIKQSDIDRMKFSSPCLGILFSLHRKIAEREKGTVFVPMFGDPFFTRTRNVHECKKLRQGFRPHVWGSFFHNEASKLKGGRKVVFVPMFGDPFFTGRWVDFSGNGTLAFSSPCLGILFSQ